MERTLTIKKLNENADITPDDLALLRKQIPNMENKECAELHDAVEAYVDRNTDMLSTNVETRNALTGLQEQLRLRSKPEPEEEASGLEKMMNDAKEYATKTADNTQAIGYRQWMELMHPGNTTTDKIVRGVGLGALAYGAYRTARWLMGKRGDSWLWRTLKFIGVSALAAWAINHFGPQEKEKMVPKAPTSKPASVVTPKAVAPPTASPQSKTTPKPAPTVSVKPETKPQAPASPDAQLKAFPENTNLVGKKHVEFMYEGKKHTVAFKADGIYLDGLKYIVESASHYDIDLTITSAMRVGEKFMTKAGAFGRSQTVEWTEADLQEVVATLLADRPYETETDDGTKVRIKRQKY